MHPFIRSLRALYGAAAALCACAAGFSCGSGAGESIDGVGQAIQAVTGNVTISGQLEDAAGDPIANVTIKLNGSKQLSTTTDFAGRYTLTVPSGGSYSVSAGGGLCASWSPSVVNLNNLTANRVVDFLGSGGGCIVAPQQGATSGSLTISGHVSSGGNAVAGANIKLNGSAQGNRISDETGAYSFSVNPGSYSLSISGACNSFTQSIVNLNNVTTSKTQNFTGNGCPPAPLTFCPTLDSLFIGQNGGPACATITTTSCPDRVNTWDVAMVLDFAIAVSGDCRFGQWAPPTFPGDAVTNYLNDLLAFTLELMGCPFQGLQAGPLTDRLVPAFFASHTFTTADLQALSDTYVAAFNQAFSDAGLPPPTAAQVSALQAQLTYLQSKVPNQTAGTTFTFSTCP